LGEEMNKSPNVKQLESNLFKITKSIYELEEKLEWSFKMDELEERVKQLNTDFNQFKRDVKFKDIPTNIKGSMRK
jgi:archaellum component FlaC